VYTECNQHPILGLMHYDDKHGTSYSPLVQQEFKKTILRRGYIHPESKTTMYHLDIHLDEVIHEQYAWSDGWNGIVHHAWDKEYVEDLYTEQVTLYMPHMLDGEPDEDMGWTASFDFGWFGLLAAEVGDTATVDTMLEYADSHFYPTWFDGGYYYPHTPDYQDNFRRDNHGKIGNISPVTGNVLVGFMRLAHKDGMWNLYNGPRDDKFFKQPFVSSVDFAQASVSQAYYDSAQEALIITIVPGPAPGKHTTFEVNQLDPARRYEIYLDGDSLGYAGATHVTAAGATWRADGVLAISSSLDSAHSYVIMATR